MCINMYCYAYVAAMCTAVSVVRFEVPHHAGLANNHKVRTFIYIYIYSCTVMHTLRTPQLVFHRKTTFGDALACSVAYGRSGFVLCGTMREILQ